jgi:N-acetylated-alpha-linked acidic dipeptidase
VLRVSAEEYRNELAELDPRQLSLETARALDGILMRSERVLVREEGLPRRPWFKHQIYAPGFYTGYGVKTLPGVREAVEQRDWREAERQVGLLAENLRQLAQQIDRATALLSGPANPAG